MENKHQVHNLIILDESGSMEEIKNSIIMGFNELIESIKEIEIKFPKQEHFISMVSFNSHKINTIHYVEPCLKLEKINSNSYFLNSLTPLYDAIGFSTNKLDTYLRGKTNYSVLVTILTDGEENASKEYSKLNVKKLIEKLKTKNWTFTYIGTNHNIEKTANELDIFNTLSFSGDTEGISKMFEIEKESRAKYSMKISNNEEKDTNYF